MVCGNVYIYDMYVCMCACVYTDLYTHTIHSRAHTPLLTQPQNPNTPHTQTQQVKFQTLVCVDTEQRCTGVVAIGDLVAYFID